jgi:hypothetical protein
MRWTAITTTPRTATVKNTVMLAGTNEITNNQLIWRMINMGRYYTGDIEGKFWFAVQPSNDPAFFGGKNTYYEDSGHHRFEFVKGELPFIDVMLNVCIDELGDNKTKLDAFFTNHDEYDFEMLAKEINVPEEEIRTVLAWYARLLLGLKIYGYLKEHDKCVFIGE